LFSDDSVSEIEYSQGTWRVAARGTAWAREIQGWEPGRDAPHITTERMEIRGIDFSWPTHALVDRVLLTAPSVHIERDAAGGFNLGPMFGGPKGPPGGGGRGPLAGPDARAGDRPDGRRQEESAEEGGGAQAPETPAVPAATKPEDKGGEKSDAQRTGSAG